MKHRSLEYPVNGNGLLRMDSVLSFHDGNFFAEIGFKITYNRRDFRAACSQNICNLVCLQKDKQEMFHSQVFMPSLLSFPVCGNE